MVLRKLYASPLKNDLELDLGVFETLKKKDPDLTVSLENKALTVIFNKLKINVGDIIGPVLKQTEVLDIDISDDHLENIIKAIYKNGL